MDRMKLTRRYHLPALHILAAPELSPEENFQLFGPCSRMHGHDYQIEVTVTGRIDPVSGLLADRDALDRLVSKNLIEPHRGTNLSEHFRHTTGEALALEFYRILRSALDSNLELDSLRLLETAKNSFVVRPGREQGTAPPKSREPDPDERGPDSDQSC